MASKSTADWISIDDKLPEIGRLVLFVCNCEHDGWTSPSTGRWTGGYTEGKAIVMDYGDSEDWYPCSHWLPIPPIPAPRNDEAGPTDQQVKGSAWRCPHCGSDKDTWFDRSFLCDQSGAEIEPAGNRCSDCGRLVD